MNAIEMILVERIRQQMQERYTKEHDDEHDKGELARFAAAYALYSTGFLAEARQVVFHPSTCSWDFKPVDPVRDLVKAGALILAEIDRLQRR